MCLIYSNEQHKNVRRNYYLCIEPSCIKKAHLKEKNAFLWERVHKVAYNDTRRLTQTRRSK